MAWQWTAFTVPLTAAFGALCVAAAYLSVRWRRDEGVPGISLAIGLVISVALTLGWYVLELSAVSLGAKLLFNQLQYLGLAMTAPFILGYVLVYVGRDDLLTPWTTGLLFLPGLVTIVVALTNDLHWLFWTDVSLDHSGPYVMITNDHGPAYAWFFGYTYAYAITAVALLGWKAVEAHGVHRGQIAALIIGVVAPLAGGVVYVLGIVPPTVPTPTYLGFVVTAIAFSWPVVHLDLFGVVPIAHRTLVDQIDDGVVACDEDGTIVTANARAATILESTSAALVGDPVEDRLAPIMADHSGSPIELGGDIDEWTATIEGRVVDVSVTRLEQSSHPVGRLIVLADVTDRHERERQLRRQNTYLDEFASVVSHDIATPLTIVENQARLIEATGDPEHVDAIFASTERIHRMMDELLELARQGKAIDETTPVDLESAVQWAWRDVVTDGATLEISSSTQFHASESRLHQLLENVLQNAVKHGTAGSGTDDERGTGNRSDRDDSGDDLTILAGALPGGFYLEDDGVGIPPADRSQVFEQGFTSNPDGSGLGLAIVERIVDAHGWTITATESDDGGARFEVTGVDRIPEEHLEDARAPREDPDTDGHDDRRPSVDPGENPLSRNGADR